MKRAFFSGPRCLCLNEELGGRPNKGCTIAGLNEMEHQGFSSALIKGIKTSAVKAGSLYKEG